jgi:pilus assembly protein Flp/PilA
MAAIEMIRRFLKDERGATAIEYGLIATLISLAIFGGVSSSGGRLGELWNENAAEIVKWLQR